MLMLPRRLAAAGSQCRTVSWEGNLNTVAEAWAVAYDAVRETMDGKKLLYAYCKQ